MITKAKYIIGVVLMALTLTACDSDDNKSDVRPGLWTELDLIETFPGDTVVVSGQASNYCGLSQLSIVCEAWGINQVYLLSGDNQKVFNFEYKMIVPLKATFDQNLRITVEDVEGNQQKKTMTYLPSTEAPQVSVNIPTQIAVEYDPTVAKGIYELKLEVSDKQALKSARIEIPAIGYDKTVELKGSSAIIDERIEIGAVGNYPMTLTLTNSGNNQAIYQSELVVMPREDEDPIEDYQLMWLLNADEQADDYMDGFYMPLSRQDAYQYQGKFFADKDGFKLYVVPTQSMDGDLFGASPYVSSKLMNKKGYVVPVTIEKAGYYGIWIDLTKNSWSVWPLEIPADAHNADDLCLAGKGLTEANETWTDWYGTMNRPADYRYTLTISQAAGYEGSWTFLFRAPR